MISDNCIKIMPELIIFTSNTGLFTGNTISMTNDTGLMTSDTA